MDKRYIRNMLRRNDENNQILWSTHFLFQLFEILYIWNSIQFEIFFMFNRKLKPSKQNFFASQQDVYY